MDFFSEDSLTTNKKQYKTGLLLITLYLVALIVSVVLIVIFQSRKTQVLFVILGTLLTSGLLIGGLYTLDRLVFKQSAFLKTYSKYGSIKPTTYSGKFSFENETTTYLKLRTFIIYHYDLEGRKTILYAPIQSYLKPVVDSDLTYDATVIHGVLVKLEESNHD